MPNRDDPNDRPVHRRYWFALYRRDVAAAARIVDRALAELGPEAVYMRVFQRALYQSGALWATGRITYADEHFVTHNTQRLMRTRVRRELIGVAPTDAPLALACGIAQESHGIGLSMVCDFLRRDGWRTRTSATTERTTIWRAIETHRPRAVLFSVGMDVGLAAAARVIGELRRRRYDGVIAIGGGAINRRPMLVQELGADLTARNAAQFARVLRKQFPTKG